MHRLLEGLMREETFDVAYVHLLRMAPYVLAPSRPLYRVLDLTDAISRELAASLRFRGPAQQRLFALEAARVARYERALVRQFEETWLISAADARALCGDCRGANVQIVPNGVDTAQFRPLEGARRSGQLAFVGHMAVLHNVDAAEYLATEILPLIRREIAGVTLKIVGPQPVARVRQLARLPGVTVTGYVADLNALLNETAVFVAPLRFSAGIQNKVLEAMAAGVPVVASPGVNIGLAAEPGKTILVAEKREEVAAAVAGLLRDPAWRQALGQAGRAWVIQHFRWDVALRRMAEIEQMLRARPPGGAASDENS
jgi:glycosyltransferase involved in cell wall biosynthesis